MIELKITGDALEVKSEIEKLFNMTSGAPTVLYPTKADEEKAKEVVKSLKEVEVPKIDIVNNSSEKIEVTEIPEVDSRGFPWDERIHASSKAINADGTWRNKRGVDSDLLHTVEAEMMQKTAPADDVVKECVGELIADGKEHETFIDGDTPALPAKEYTDKDVTSSMIKMVTALGAVDGSIISPVTQKVLGKFNASAITDIKEQSDRAEFVRMCEAVADNPSQWETIL